MPNNYLIESKNIVDLISAVVSIQKLDGDLMQFTNGIYSIFSTDRYYDIENVITVIIDTLQWNSPSRGDEEIRGQMFDVMLDINSGASAEDKYKRMLEICGID